MSDFDDLLRATLADRSADAPDPDQLTDRVLAAIQDERSTGTTGRRRRHWQRWGAPLAAAASVAAVVAAGIGISHSSHGSRPVADSAVQTSSRTTSPAGSAKPTTSSSASIGGAITAPPTTQGSPQTGETNSVTPVASPVPSTFRAADLTFDSPTSGYALGTVACATGRCTRLARLDATTSLWTLVGSQPPFQVGTQAQSSGAPVVAHVRFASASVGYAYGVDTLWMTLDSGATWTKQDVSAQALEVADGTVVAVSSAADCASSCSYHVAASNTGEATWTDVTLPGGDPTGSSVQLARTGPKVYLAVQSASASTGSVYASTNGGYDWTESRTQLCGAAANTTAATLAGLAAAADGSVTALCSSVSASFTLTSTDAGADFAAGVPYAFPSAATAVAAASADVLVVQAKGLYRSVDGGQSWTAVPSASTASATAPQFLGFESPSLGRWVSGDGSSVWTTTDSGQSWKQTSFSG